ncbi:MAG: phenylphosphate carboxylase subunit gamma [Deltaproteobacteria bacterium]|nr:MAG: phenylphosphate carboxylase subunit gamma [Deltaproteobacteria bacterium]
MKKKEYLAWVKDLKELPQGEEIKLTIRDLTSGQRKYEARNVRAILYSSPEKLPDGDTLRFRSPVGVLLPDSWVIKITEELGEYLRGTPYQEVLSL